MEPKPSDNNPRLTRRRVVQIKDTLREVRGELTALNQGIGERAGLREADLHCLDVISRDGPLGPSDVARRVGVHPATMTGVLDRLERGGWILREPHPNDRRAVLVRAAPQRGRELAALYAGMNTAVDDICARYGDAELNVIIDFLTRVADAGRTVRHELAEPAGAQPDRPRGW